MTVTPEQLADQIVNLKWTKNPGLPVPPREVVIKSLETDDPKDLAARVERWIATYERREKAIELAQKYPLTHGIEFDCWKDADELLVNSSLLALFGGNRAGKSEWAARRVTKTILDHPNTFIMCVCQKLQTSGILMQKKIFENLPEDIRALNNKTDPKGTFNIRFSEANGFSNNILVLPNRSKIIFVGYSQETKDYEGLELGCPDAEVIGAWAEEDMPLAWLELLRMRLATTGGKLIWTFTAVDGLTKAMQDVCKGLRVVKSLRAKELEETCKLLPDCPEGHAPYICATHKPKDNIIYFFTEFNPYANYSEVLENCKGKPTFFYERRLYGFARAARGRQFPQFSSVHIIKPDEVPFDQAGLNYMVLDPSAARNWFMLWARLVEWETPRWYIYREWPSQREFGEWAVTSRSDKDDGDKGSAQDPLGYGYVEYKQILKKCENEKISARVIDPRAGSEQKQVDNGQTSIIDQMYSVHRDSAGQIVGASYDFIPAQGLREETGIAAINDLLQWNPKEKLDPIMNAPNLYISEDCGNLIDAMEMYTGKDGLKAACKDPIDCLRYLVTYGFEYVDPASIRSTGGFSY